LSPNIVSVWHDQYISDLAYESIAEFDVSMASTSRAGGITASGLPLGNTIGSLLNVTGGLMTANDGNVLNLGGLLTGGNDTLLDTLGLGSINLAAAALVPSATCPGGGLLNAQLNLGAVCVGAEVITAGQIANICVLQNGTCCCSPGKQPFFLLFRDCSSRK
jgi:hypothetical protein